MRAGRCCWTRCWKTRRTASGRAPTSAPDNPYFVPGLGVPVWVGIELMAQAIAAHAGLGARREQKPPRAGMLLGTRRFEASAAYFPAKAGARGARAAGFRRRWRPRRLRLYHRLQRGRILVKATIIIVEISKENMG